jgi:metal-responsive CopG/Arc/MetJ family transcriptional regulator
MEEPLKETKTKYAIYLYPSQMEEIKNLMDQANAKSQSEFVSDAIRFYIGYLQQGKNVDYLAPIIAQTIQEEIRSTEKNISQILFKLAVESAMLSELQATQIRVPQDQMEQLRRMCSRIVAENNGIITLEKAVKHQQG